MQFSSSEIDTLREKLLAWYQKHKRDLPWRKTKDPYAIWVSEVMLQQTQVVTVIPYYGRFLARFPDIRKLAQAEQQQVLKIWEGLGYYARARNFHRAAGMVCDLYKGQIPSDWTLFRQLPGVGDYIAAAVLSIAFDQPHAVVDGNVKRVFARCMQIETPVNTTRSHAEFKSVAEAALDRSCAGDFNQAVMELGATVCTPRQPACIKCPLADLCQVKAKNQIAHYPRRIARRKTPLYRIAIGVVMKNDRLLITQRNPDGLLGGLWEFPGGKIKKGESAEEAVVREIQEEVNLTVAVQERLARVKHAYTHFKIEMDVFICRFSAGRIRLRGPVDFRWVTAAGIDRFPLPKANHKFLPKLKRALTRYGYKI